MPAPDESGHVDLESRAVGDTFRVHLARCGSDPQATLVVLDGDGLSGLATDLVRLMQLPGLLPPLDVVGVGYPGARSIGDTLQVRRRDLTPTAADASSGGAERFLAFLRDELFPWLREARGAGPLRQTVLFGHSLGGLLTLYDALRPDAVVDHHLVSSPSLWWDRHWLLREHLPAAAAAGRLDRDVLVGIGGEETDEGRRREAAALPPGHPAKPPRTRLDMVADVRLLEERVRQAGVPGLRLAVTVLPDEYHATVAPVVLSRGLRHVFEGQPGQRST